MLFRSKWIDWGRNDNLSDVNFVESLYRNLLNRESETTGRDYWVQKLSNENKTRRWVVDNFLGSTEFNFTINDIQLVYGDVPKLKRMLVIRDLFGSYEFSRKIDDSGNISNELFVTSIFEKILDRNPNHPVASSAATALRRRCCWCLSC